MKESKLIEMRNKIEVLGNSMNRVVQELHNLKDLAVGTMMVTKKLPGYTEALEELKKKTQKKKKIKSNGII